MIDQQLVAIGIFEPRFGPAPGLIYRLLFKNDSLCFQLTNTLRHVFDFEVKPDPVAGGKRFHNVEGKGRCAVRTEEASVVIVGVNDELQAEHFVKGDRTFKIADGDGDLIEIHGAKVGTGRDLSLLCVVGDLARKTFKGESKAKNLREPQKLQTIASKRRKGPYALCGFF